MKRLILFLMALALTACGTAGPTLTPTATPNPGEIALQMVQQEMAAKATQQIVGLQFTATAQVLGVTATYQAAATQQAVTVQARNDAQATADQIRRDAQATQQRIDADATQAQAQRDARATADQAVLNLQATQQAQATSTSFVMTQVVLPTHAAWTQQAVEQSILLDQNQVELSNLQVEQQHQKNTIEWVWPIALTIFLALALALYAWGFSQVREIKNADGDIEMIIYKNKQAVAPRLLPKPVLELGTGEMPDVTDPGQQAEIVRRDQMVRALAVMPVSPAGNGAQAFNQAFRTAQRPYEIVDADAIPANLLDGEAVKALENDWKDAHE